jgi:hypothetical protein
MGDLHSLNSRQKLTNGQVPLRIWLENAIRVIFSGLPEEQIFKEALTAMETPAAPGETTVAIVEGFEAWIELIKGDPVARKSVVIYRDRFETAQREIDIIANYKFLHDGLHKVQLTWLEPAGVKAFLDQGEVMNPSLLNYSASLNNTCRELRRTYENGFVDEGEKGWIEELEGYQDNLENVLNGNIPDTSPPTLDPNDVIINAFVVVKELLASKLSQLNLRLKDAISTLHLLDLIKAMNTVCERVTKLSPDPGKTVDQLIQYKTGMDHLSKLEQLLKKLVQEHDSWQSNDNYLRTLGDMLKKGIQQSATAREQAVASNGNSANTQLESKGEVWSSVQEIERLGTMKTIRFVIHEKVTPLLTDKTTFWSKRLLTAARKFNDEVDKGETTKAEQTFDAFRQQAWHFFFEIDTEMKNRCEELKVIGEELRRINNQLGFNEEWEV